MQHSDLLAISSTAKNSGNKPMPVIFPHPLIYFTLPVIIRIYSESETI